MPKHDMIILLSEANRGVLDRVAPDVFDEPVRREYLNMFLADPRHVMFVAVDTEIVVGMVSGVEYFHPDKSPQLWINEVGVAPAYRRRGIGRRLTEAMIAEAERRGCTYAWLGTDIKNVPAQRCFESTADVEAPQSFLLYEWGLQED